MLSRWTAVVALVRELSSVRSHARTLDPDLVGVDVALEVEKAISDAAQAVDIAIDGPEDDALLVSACEAIVIATERIADLRETAGRSGLIVARSIELQRRAASLLYESITGRTAKRQPS